MCIIYLNSRSQRHSGLQTPAHLNRTSWCMLVIDSFAVFREGCPLWLVPWGTFMSTSEAHQSHSGEAITQNSSIIVLVNPCGRRDCKCRQPQFNSQSITVWRECSLLIISTRGSNYQRAKKELPHWGSAMYPLNVCIPPKYMCWNLMWEYEEGGLWGDEVMRVEPSRMRLVPS